MANTIMNNIPTKISLPLTDEEIDKYYDTIEAYNFEIQLKDSLTLKPKQIINYIANTRMHCDINTDDVDDTLVDELIKEYVTTNRQLTLPLFNKIIINALIDVILKKENPLNQEFIERNKDLLDELILVLYNLKYACEITIAGEEYGDFTRLGDDKNNSMRQVLPKETCLGANIINLRHDDEFWTIMMLLECVDKPLYYYDCFNDTGIKGYNMIYYIVSEKNPLGVAAKNLYVH